MYNPAELCRNISTTHAMYSVDYVLCASLLMARKQVVAHGENSCGTATFHLTEEGDLEQTFYFELGLECRAIVGNTPGGYMYVSALLQFLK